MLDALREDPDVLMSAKCANRKTMRLTLNAAETGHLVLATVHSGTCAEACNACAGVSVGDPKQHRGATGDSLVAQSASVALSPI